MRINKPEQYLQVQSGLTLFNLRKAIFTSFFEVFNYFCRAYKK